jgi:tubulin-specific chaperone B
VHNPDFMKSKPKVELADDYMEEEAKAIILGIRCEVIIGKRRGEVRYTGKVPKLGKGYWVGIKLDEPLGDSTGTVEGTSYFSAQDKYGLFVRPKEVLTGDYPEKDEFDSGDDEI